jgi:hypothetical protein
MKEMAKAIGRDGAGLEQRGILGHRNGVASDRSSVSVYVNQRATRWSALRNCSDWHLTEIEMPKGKLPKRYNAVVMPLILSLLMTSVVSAISILRAQGLTARLPSPCGPPHGRPPGRSPFPSCYWFCQW